PSSYRVARSRNSPSCAGGRPGNNARSVATTGMPWTCRSKSAAVSVTFCSAATACQKSVTLWRGVITTPSQSHSAAREAFKDLPSVVVLTNRSIVRPTPAPPCFPVVAGLPILGTIPLSLINRLHRLRVIPLARSGQVQGGLTAFLIQTQRTPGYSGVHGTLH